MFIMTIASVWPSRNIHVLHSVHALELLDDLATTLVNKIVHCYYRGMHLCSHLHILLHNSDVAQTYTYRKII